MPQATTVLAVLLAVQPASAERPRIEVTGGSGCAGLAARYVALLEADSGGVVLSAAPFPGSDAVGLTPEGRPASAVAADPELRIAGAPGEIHVLLGRELAKGVVGCLGFDKEQFTWESDLLTYVRYLADLLREAQRFDPAQRALVLSDRTVRLEVRRPGGEFAVLADVEGSMMGFGRPSDELRYFLVPVLLGPAGDSVLVRILRNRGSAFGERATEHFASVLLQGNEPVTTDTDPPFHLRRVD